jgi:hypothetical protein
MGNLAAWSLLLLAAGSAQATDLFAPLRACSEQRDDAARLACFDREIAALQKSSPADHQPVPAAAAPAKLERLTARVKQVQELSYGRKRIVLDNGQIWSQVSSSEQIDLQAGDAVNIRPAMLGSFLLIDPRGRSAKVHREQ